MANLSCLSVDDHSSSLMDNGPDHSLNKASNVLTLEPYSFGINSRKPRGRNLKPNNRIEIIPGSFESIHYARFVVLKMKNGQRMREFDMFELNREILDVCEKEPKISFLNDGSLLIEVSSPEESMKIQSLVSLDGSYVESKPHATLNQVKGVIRSVELLRYSEEKIQKELEDQGVVEVKQMKKTVGGLLTPLPTYVLTFDRLKLPNIIHAAWLRLEVRPYIPAVRRCFYCQKFGHVINNCRKRMKGEKSSCENCGREEHGECNNHPCCVNCGEDHPASSKKCKKFIFEKEVQAIRTKEHLSFKEARQRVNASYIRAGTTFSSIITKSSPVNNKETRTVKASQERIKTRPSNQKRRLSGEREESASKIHIENPFSVLRDEITSEAINHTVVQNTKKTMICSSDSGANQAGSSFSVYVQPEVGSSRSAPIPDLESPVSVSLLDQAAVSNNEMRESSSDLLNASENNKDAISDIHFERADSFVSACSENEQINVSLEENIEEVLTSVKDKLEVLPPVDDKAEAVTAPLGNKSEEILSPGKNKPEVVVPSVGDSSKVHSLVDKKPTSYFMKRINSASGTIPKSSLSNVNQHKKEQNGNRKLKMPKSTMMLNKDRH